MKLRTRMLYTIIKDKLPCKVRIINFSGEESIRNVTDVFIHDDFPNCLYLTYDNKECSITNEKRVMGVIDNEP